MSWSTGNIALRRHHASSQSCHERACSAIEGLLYGSVEAERVADQSREEGVSTINVVRSNSRKVFKGSSSIYNSEKLPSQNASSQESGGCRKRLEVSGILVPNHVAVIEPIKHLARDS